MKTVTATYARQNFRDVVDYVKTTGNMVTIKNHGSREVIIMKFPKTYDPRFSEIANLNAYFAADSEIKDEPDLYSRADIIKQYD